MVTGGLQITISSNEYSKLNLETVPLCSVQTTGERETQLGNVLLSVLRLLSDKYLLYLVQYGFHLVTNEEGSNYSYDK